MPAEGRALCKNGTGAEGRCVCIGTQRSAQVEGFFCFLEFTVA